MRHARGAVGITVVLACVFGTMALGAASKAPCASGDFSNGRQYRLLCYTDIVPLLGTEQLAGGRLPFFDRCQASDNNCDEYPVLTMYLMRVAAWFSGNDYASFFSANAILLLGFAMATAFCLWMLGDSRALWFALAPTLLIYGTINWDLAAVACATAALVAFAKRRDGWAGVLIGVGAATKFYPALVLVPLFLQGLQDREPDRSVRVLWWSAGTWIAVNLPFAIAAPGPWWEFFRFNAARTPDFDSVWYVACKHVPATCISIDNVNLAALTAFLVAAFIAIYLKGRRDPSFPRWACGVPLLICFLLTNKVYSPQYSLWLLPWFALTMPRLGRFVAFEAADVAVFVTRFWFFGAYTGTMTFPQQWWFELALAIRAGVLVWCLIAWVHDDLPPLRILHGRVRARDPVPQVPVPEIA